MSVAGYINAYPTPYGEANFWIVSELSYTAATGATITLFGYPTESDANTASILGTLPMGTYSFVLTPMQTATLFGGAQTLMQAAIQGSSAAWSGATFVPAG